MDIKMLLATLPEDANLAAWCRKVGVSRQTAYKWRRRFKAEGAAGLEERSRSAKVIHGRTAADVEDLVVAWRKRLAEDGLDSGPASVRDRLIAETGVVLSDATVWRILSRRGQINPQPKKRPRSSWRRFARERPNECWQGDDTHYVLAGGVEVRIINMVDDHSRLNVDSLAVELCRSARIWESFCRGVQRHGVPAEFLNDNGRAWRSEDGSAPVSFQAQLSRLGVRHIHSSPYHPQTCGKVERFHKTQQFWLDARPPARTVGELQELLDAFRHVYNHERPHKGVGRRTPASVWAAQAPASPARAAIDPPTTIGFCRVSDRGTIKPANRLRIGVGVEWEGCEVIVVRRGAQATVIDVATAAVIRELTVDPDRVHQPMGTPRGGRARPRRRPIPNV